MYVNGREDSGEGETILNERPQSGLPVSAFEAMAIVIYIDASSDDTAVCFLITLAIFRSKYLF